MLNSNPRAELARRNLIDFVLYTKEDYQVNWHHEVLCSYLDKFIRGDVKKLMVFMPPQHGKSELVSRRLPAMYLGKHPKTKIVLASYSDDLVSSFNRDCQRIIDEPRYQDVFPDTFLSGSDKAVKDGKTWLRNLSIFETVGQGGFLKTVGVGGSLTGTPADVGIIDDPVKDSIEASSDTYKKRNWEWYNDVFLTRLHNRSKILLTMTRWDTDDLAGMILKHDPDQWTMLRLPAVREAEENPDDKRKIGEPLWGEMHSLERLLKVQAQSKRTFAALYQQNPSPVQTGGEFYRSFRSAASELKSSHVGHAPYNKDLALHISFDFNVNPYMTCTIYQVNGKKVYQVKEICLPHPRNTTKAICRDFMQWAGNHSAGLYVYGDPQGLRQSTADETEIRVHEKDYSEFNAIAVSLAKYKPQMRTLRAYPGVKLRGDFINAVFEDNFDGIEILIDSTNTISIADFNYVKEDKDGTKLKKGSNMARDSNTGASYEKYGHTSDSFDYFMVSCFSDEFYKHQSGGYLPQIKIGKNISKNKW